MRILILIAIITTLINCSSDDNDKNINSNIVGKWALNKVGPNFCGVFNFDDDNKKIIYEFKADNRLNISYSNIEKSKVDKVLSCIFFEFDAQPYTYSIVNDSIHFSSSKKKEKIKYKFKIIKNKLELVDSPESDGAHSYFSKM